MHRGFTRLLRRHSVALLALFLALGGTSYAASTLVGKNSVGSAQVINGSLQTKDLSKKARKALKGNRGPRGLRGAQGPQGATGAQGVHGIQGTQGVQGPPGPFPEVLPEGKTIRGDFYILGRATAGGQQSGDSISFVYPLASPIPDASQHFIAAGTAPPADCPGTVANPQAAPGTLCVYEQGANNASNRGIDPGAGQPVKYGSGLYAQADAAGDYWSVGTWAVTGSGSPSAAPASPATSDTPTH
jgi:hypothetical protein